MSEHTSYLTKTGFLMLRQELNHLLKVERPSVVKDVSWAASNGDRSENGDYIYGKKRLRQIDSRVKYLLTAIEDSKIIDPKEQENRSRIFFGATVQYLNLLDNSRRREEQNFLMIYAHKILPLFLSPLGLALICLFCAILFRKRRFSGFALLIL